MTVGLDKRSYNGAPFGIAQFGWEAELHSGVEKRHWSFDEELKTRRAKARKSGRTPAQLAMLASL